MFQQLVAKYGDRVMHEDILWTKTNEKELTELAKIIMTPSELTKFNEKYKKQVPKDFYFKQFDGNPITDLFMKTVQVTCFKKSYYKPMLIDGLFNVQDKKHIALYDLLYYGIHWNQYIDFSHYIAIQDAFRVVDVTKPLPKKEHIDKFLQIFRKYTFAPPINKKENRVDFSSTIMELMKCRPTLYKLTLSWYNNEPPAKQQKYIDLLKKQVKDKTKTPPPRNGGTLIEWIKETIQYIKDTQN